MGAGQTAPGVFRPTLSAKKMNKIIHSYLSTHTHTHTTTTKTDPKYLQRNLPLPFFSSMILCQTTELGSIF